MNSVRAICNAGLHVRSKNNIKVRQPTAKVTIIIDGETDLDQFSEIKKEELNVKNVVTSKEIGKYCKYEFILNIE